MNIIQSFSWYDQGNPYMVNSKNNYNMNCNFYVIMLSCLTLQKYYGTVTMYCDPNAYNRIIKYIPYGKILIEENKNDFSFWNKYKIDSMKQTSGDVVHVDPDVFIFDKLFDPFKGGDYDIMVQDILPQQNNFVKDFVYNNKEFYEENNIIDTCKFDGKCICCGVIGFKEKIKHLYYEAYDKLYHGFKTGKISLNGYPVHMTHEEMTVYLVALQNNLKIYDILPYNLILEKGVLEAGNEMKYTHLWLRSKFREDIIDKVKNKIKTDFPQNYHIVEKFERDIMKIKNK